MKSTERRNPPKGAERERRGCRSRFRGRRWLAVRRISALLSHFAESYQNPPFVCFGIASLGYPFFDEYLDLGERYEKHCI